MKSGNKIRIAILIAWLFVHNISLGYLFVQTGNLKTNLETSIELGKIEKIVLVSICKLELGESIEHLNKTIKQYEATIETAVPPEHIERYVEILKLDIGRRENLMNALKVLERTRTQGDK
jgi:hypothetical protein